VGLVLVYVLNSSTAQSLLQIGTDHPVVDNRWFVIFLTWEAGMSFLLVAWGGPGNITKDFANHSIQLYLSRPLSRAEYLFGKVSVLGALLSCTTWIPALILFFVQADLQDGWLSRNYWMAGSIVLVCLLWIAVISLLSMAIAVSVRWRIAATALMLGVFFVLPVIGQIIDHILRTHLGYLLNFPLMIFIIGAHLFRLTASVRHASGFDLVPLWQAWASVLGLCVFCVYLLHRKLVAREVERA